MNLESGYFCNAFSIEIIQNIKNYIGVKIVKKSIFISLVFSIIGVLILIPAALAAPKYERNPNGFIHGITIEIDGKEYYFKGPGSEPGVIDVPGHSWVQTGPYRVVGRHYNIGPYNKDLGSYVPAWWAPLEDDGILLFKVDGIIAPWSPEIAESMAKRGYIHYHEILYANTLKEHETLVLWLKHTAVSSFYFAPIPMPAMAHDVTPGIDFGFMPNYMMPYNL